MAEPLIIISAPNGARRQKSDHPGLPLTPDEMARCAREIADAGASMLHLHVRDARGAHSLDPARARVWIAAIRKRVGHDLIIQVTTEAVGKYSRAEQIDMVKDLKPEAVSLALREICPSDHELPETARFISWMAKTGVFPQYILYDEDDYRRFERYRRQGIFESARPFALFVLGSYQGSSPASNAMAGRLQNITRDASFPWAVCGFDDNEAASVDHAVTSGGHVRVGFENNIWRADGELLGSHAEMIGYAVAAARSAGRPVANASQIRDILGTR